MFFEVKPLVCSLYLVLDPSMEHAVYTHWGALPQLLLISKQTANSINLLEYNIQA